jgi:soluble lytic murein transglycosylase-like protein
MMLLLATPALGELVGVLKVEGFHRDGDGMRLLLTSGGVLRLPMLRIERIVADEVQEEEGAERLWDGADLAVAFSEGQHIPPLPFGELIYDAAKRHAINPRLVAAMVETESGFDPYAVSSKGAAGLLQLMPATAHRFGLSEQDVFDPARNLDAGVRYIRWLSEHFDQELPLVLAGYNAGEATVERFGGVPPYRETRNYIRRIYSVAMASTVEPAAE